MATTTDYLTQLQQDKSDLVDNLTEQGITGLTGDETFTQLVPKVLDIESGGGETPEAEEKDVNFYDYDGKRVYSYTKNEFLALSSLPANPTHQGLTAQGWNWSYQDAVDYVTEYGVVDIGQVYTTDDGSTRIKIVLYEGRTDPYLGICINGSAEIDWGDGSTKETMTGTSTTTLVSLQHHYEPGAYTISIMPLNDTNIAFYYSSQRASFLLSSGETNAYSQLNYIYRNSIIEINIGNNIVIDYYGLSSLSGLKRISIPNSVTYFGYRGCSTSVNIILPSNFNRMDQYAYENSNQNIKFIFNGSFRTALSNTSVTTLQRKLILPPRVEMMLALTANRVSKIIFPKNITQLMSIQIGGAKIVDFTHFKSVPLLLQGTGLGELASDCQVVVPDSLYEEWIVANNWSNYASKIIKKSDFDNQ